jgi:hypothetical protein
MSKKKSSKKSIKKLHLDKPTSHGGWPDGHSGSYRDPNTPVNKQIEKFLSDMGLLDDDNPRARLSEDKIRVKRVVLEGLLKKIISESENQLTLNFDEEIETEESYKNDVDTSYDSLITYFLDMSKKNLKDFYTSKSYSGKYFYEAFQIEPKEADKIAAEIKAIASHLIQISRNRNPIKQNNIYRLQGIMNDPKEFNTRKEVINYLQRNYYYDESIKIKVKLKNVVENCKERIDAFNNLDHIKDLFNKEKLNKRMVTFKNQIKEITKLVNTFSFLTQDDKIEKEIVEEQVKEQDLNHKIIKEDAINSNEYFSDLDLFNIAGTDPIFSALEKGNIFEGFFEKVLSNKGLIVYNLNKVINNYPFVDFIIGGRYDLISQAIRHQDRSINYNPAGLTKIDLTNKFKDIPSIKFAQVKSGLSRQPLGGRYINVDFDNNMVFEKSIIKSFMSYMSVIKQNNKKMPLKNLKFNFLLASYYISLDDAKEEDKISKIELEIEKLKEKLSSNKIQQYALEDSKTIGRENNKDKYIIRIIYTFLFKYVYDNFNTNIEIKANIIKNNFNINALLSKEDVVNKIVSDFEDEFLKKQIKNLLYSFTDVATKNPDEQNVLSNLSSILDKDIANTKKQIRDISSLLNKSVIREVKAIKSDLKKIVKKSTELKVSFTESYSEYVLSINSEGEVVKEDSKLLGRETKTREIIIDNKILKDYIVFTLLSLNVRQNYSLGRTVVGIESLDLNKIFIETNNLLKYEGSLESLKKNDIKKIKQQVLSLVTNALQISSHEVFSLEKNKDNSFHFIKGVMTRADKENKELMEYLEGQLLSENKKAISRSIEYVNKTLSKLGITLINQQYTEQQKLQDLANLLENDLKILFSKIDTYVFVKQETEKENNLINIENVNKMMRGLIKDHIKFILKKSEYLMELLIDSQILSENKNVSYENKIKSFVMFIIINMTLSFILNSIPKEIETENIKMLKIKYNIKEDNRIINNIFSKLSLISSIDLSLDFKEKSEEEFEENPSLTLLPEPKEKEQDKDEILGLTPQDNNEPDDLPYIEDDKGIIDITALRRQQDYTEEDEEDLQVAESKLLKLVVKDLFEYLNR